MMKIDAALATASRSIDSEVTAELANHEAKNESDGSVKPLMLK